MNLLEAIIDVTHTACPEFEIHAGFNADIREFLEQHSVTKPLIFIGVAAEVPVEYSEDGKALVFQTAFHLFIRASTKHRLAHDLYDQYITLRESLNGVVLETDNGTAHIQIVSGENQAYANVREATLSVIATD